MSQDYWIFSFVSCLIFKKQLFQKLDLFPSSGKGMGAVTQFGGLQRINPSCKLSLGLYVSLHLQVS
jgi:hypothetical protein